MNNAERSLFVFGIYMIVIVGLGLMLIPTFILDLFQLSYGDDTWIRFVGMLTFLVGVYYLVVVKEKLSQIYIWTVWLRCFAVAFMITMFVIGKAGVSILGFAAVDAIGAAWTFLSLKK